MQSKAALMGILVSSVTIIAPQVRAAVDYPYAYEFESSVPGVSGEIFLDTSSSSDGTVADIGPGSYLTFNLYNGYIPAVTFDLSSLSTSLDPSFTFSWNASEITTPLDFSVGLGNNDVLLNREFVNPQNTSAIAPEYDVVDYYDVFVGAGQNVLNSQSVNESIVSLIATEATTGVGGAGVTYNIPFDGGSLGEWVAVAVPEPGKMALVTCLGALAMGLFGRGKRQETVAHLILKSALRRMPPNRG